MKDTCKKCGYWTNKPGNKYKCYLGDCPAKLRDDSTRSITLKPPTFSGIDLMGLDRVMVADLMREVDALRKKNTLLIGVVEKLTKELLNYDSKSKKK